MAAEPKMDIPILTDALFERLIVPGSTDERETLIAELQTEIAASMFALTDEIMRKAFTDMEASIYEQITGRLRRELPDVIDTLLRERLGDTSSY